AGTYAQVSLTVTPQPVAPGGTLTIAIAATNATSHAPLPALSVYVQLDSVSYNGPCGGVLATATGSTDTNGSFAVGLTVPGCYFGTAASVSVTVTGGGYYGSNQTNVAVNLDGLSGLFAALQTYPYNIAGFVAIMAIAVGVGLLLSARHKRKLDARRRPSPFPPPPGPAGPATPGTPPPGAQSALPAPPNGPSGGTSTTTPVVGAVVPATAPARAATVPAHVAGDRVYAPGFASTATTASVPRAPPPAGTTAVAPSRPSRAPTAGDAFEPTAATDAGWCDTCDAPVPVGASACPACGTPVRASAPS
ncbi:MAG TPA: hypothetical protein VGP88_03595, partial [Thermoplasmata archaeon]|nr:hypothetical protein [Thermoplasmata archaeon]